MARRVQWSEVAWDDLDQIADYIARDSRHYAAGFVRRVREAARSLTDLPLRGRVVPEFERPQVREIPVQKYRLIYRVTDDYVDILALVHGARDLRALWDREDRPEPGE